MFIYFDFVPDTGRRDNGLKDQSVADYRARVKEQSGRTREKRDGILRDVDAGRRYVGRDGRRV